MIMLEMKCLWDAGEGFLERCEPVLVERRGTGLEEADGGCRLRQTGTMLLMGWSETLDGEAAIVDRLDGAGSYRVPLAEWRRVNA
jgi:hypothetical protein